MGSHASCGSSLVSLMAFLIGLPSGVMNRGVLIRGVFLLVPLGVSAGEWNWEGGSDTIGGVRAGGVGATDTGRGVIGAELIDSVS